MLIYLLKILKVIFINFLFDNNIINTNGKVQQDGGQVADAGAGEGADKIAKIINDRENIRLFYSQLDIRLEVNRIGMTSRTLDRISSAASGAASGAFGAIKGLVTTRKQHGEQQGVTQGGKSNRRRKRVKRKTSKRSKKYRGRK